MHTFLCFLCYKNIMHYVKVIILIRIILAGVPVKWLTFLINQNKDILKCMLEHCQEHKLYHSLTFYLLGTVIITSKCCFKLYLS